MADASSSQPPAPAPAAPSTNDKPASDKPTPAPPAADTSKPSNAELKKQKKAEKAARRAQEKGDASVPTAGPSDSRAPARPQQRRPSQPASARPDTLPTRSRAGAPSSAAAPAARKEPRREDKTVPFYAHLAAATRRTTLDATPREVHPAIQALGLQSAAYTITGSHARCAAMLLALKSVVQSYKTPPDQTLARHLNSAHLSPQLSFLKACRPFGVAQANAVRWLKNVVAKVDPSTPEPAAKSEICRAIDTFVHERLTVADQAIAEAVAATLRDGDVVLTYAKSAAVTLALTTAARAGRRFRVVCVDSRPLHEGRALAAVLSRAGIETAYAQLTGLAHAVRGATRCLLGAHAVLGNGRVYSRAGTALVAMAAHGAGATVTVCAESIKFTERVALDAVVMNELAPEDELLGEDEAAAGDSLVGWRGKERLQLLNLLFDVTPTEYVASIVTELGALAPASALVVQRMSAGAQEGESIGV